MRNTLLGIKFQDFSRKNTLEEIAKSVEKHDKFTHVVSLNPEIVVIAHKNAEFMRIINGSDIRIVDGVGVLLAGRLLGHKIDARLSGVDLMNELIWAKTGLSLRIALIGGTGNLAEKLSQRYSQARPEAKFFGTEGFKNVKNPEKNEEIRLKTEITALRPHLVFVSFGSPDQEIWIENNRNLFKNAVVIGVGGAFDFLGGRVKRAPVVVRRMGLEWLFRLFIQPWRWKRQLRLVEFSWLVLNEFIWRKK